MERFLNICTYNGITVWGIRKKKGCLSLYISIRDFKTLRTLLRGKGIRVHISKKTGIPFIVNRYKKRYGIAVAAVMFFVIITFLSGFIWNINVAGNDLIEDAEILKACEKIGIHEGIRSKSIDAWDKRIDLQLEVDGLSWVAINIEGCQMTIDVREENTPQKDNKSPCNLVAEYDGVIKKIESTSGDNCVAVGDAVTKGDLLVSGVVELSNGNTHFVHAGGKVLAEVDKEYTVSVPLNQKINYLSGDVTRRFLLKFFSFKIPLYLGSFSDNALMNIKEHTISFEESYLPISLYSGEAFNVAENETELSEEDAVKIAEDKINIVLDGKEIIEKNNVVIKNQGSVSVVCKVKLLIDIAREEFLLFNTTN